MSPGGGNVGSDFGEENRIGKEEGSGQRSHVCRGQEAGAVLETSSGLTWLAQRL